MWHCNDKSNQIYYVLVNGEPTQFFNRWFNLPQQHADKTEQQFSHYEKWILLIINPFRVVNDQTKMNNHFLAIVSPFSTDVDSVPIEQNSILSLANIDEGVSLNYNTHFESASCYFFIIEGEVEFAGERLKKRDAIALTDITTITIIAKKTSKLLCIETT